MEYAKNKKEGSKKLQKANQKGTTEEPRFVQDSIAEMEQLRKNCLD